MSSGSGDVALRDCLGEMGFSPEQILSALRALGNDCSVEDAALFILASREDQDDRYNEEIPPSLSIHPPESKMMLVVREDLGQSQPSRACAALSITCASMLTVFRASRDERGQDRQSMCSRGARMRKACTSASAKRGVPASWAGASALAETRRDCVLPARHFRWRA